MQHQPTELLIPGPAHNALADALDLPRDCTVRDMIAEIGRLHMAAAEGSRFAEGRHTTERGRKAERHHKSVDVPELDAWTSEPQEPDAA